jgi:hypothetical protein
MSPKRSTTLNDVIATARAQDRVFDRGMALLENGNRSLAEEVTVERVARSCRGQAETVCRDEGP